MYRFPLDIYSESSTHTVICTRFRDVRMIRVLHLMVAATFWRVASVV